jgi:signal peptidase II
VVRRGRLAVVLYAVAAGAYLLDRLTKFLAVRYLAGEPPVQVIPHVVQLRYTTNAGGAFGLFGSQPWLFFAATLLVCAVIAIASTRLSSSVGAVGLGLILGGALGNLTDRILRGPGVSGRVVDFIDFHVWPVFNTADSAIVVGALVILVAGLRRQQGADDR